MNILDKIFGRNRKSAPILEQPSQVQPETPRPTTGRVLVQRGSDLVSLEGPVTADISIDFSGSNRLAKLPNGLRTGTLTLTNCVALQSLPSGLDVAFLDLEGCEALTELPEDLNLRGGRLNLKNCASLTHIPDNIGEVAQLDVSGCLNLTQLPEDLQVTSWVDIGGSGITELPETYAHLGLRWNGVAISRQTAFEPSSLSCDQILSEQNAELRRVMIERFGYDRFMEDAGATEIDSDTDAGGARRLLRIEIPDDEPLVCVAVQCPSTEHKFMLRVPPNVTTCHQAVAWTAGYDNPSQYQPDIET